MGEDHRHLHLSRTSLRDLLATPNDVLIRRLQGRLKKHRWHKKILKNKDPLIFSVSMAVFSL